MDVLTPDGIYIAFNGSALYVWLGKSCDASCIHEMFGFSSVDQADGAQARAQFTRCFARLKLLQQALLFTRKTSVRCVPTQPLHSRVCFTFCVEQDRSRRCCNVLRAVQALVPHSCPIQMVKQGGLLEIKFHMCLIEDRSATFVARCLFLLAVFFRASSSIISPSKFLYPPF
jgi:hypothetical protein